MAPTCPTPFAPQAGVHALCFPHRFSPHKAQMRAIVLILLASTQLLACRGEEIRGTPDPPPAFGQIERPWFGCPDLSGLYAWPADAGQPFGYRRDGKAEDFSDFLGLPRYPQAQIWIEGPATAHALVLRTRLINRNPRLQIRSLTSQWSRHQFDSGDYRCHNGAVILAERDLDEQKARAWSSHRVRIGAQLLRLEDGSLAVGQSLREWGRVTPFGWGDRSFFHLKAPDRVSWYWSRLRRLGPTGEGLPPDDAALRDGR